MESWHGWCFCYCVWCCGWHVLKFHSNLLALANRIKTVVARFMVLLGSCCCSFLLATVRRHIVVRLFVGIS
jgi:hypothetical protein